MFDFGNCKTIEEAKKMYRKYSMGCHPDHGGDEESFKILQNEFEKVCQTILSNGWKESGKNTEGKDQSNFETILNAILDWNIEIEIIGHWIYARKSYEYKDDLKDLGFWYSGKHKAWIYSGSRKIKKATRLNINQIRNRYGSEYLKTKEVKKIS